jgi:hypothetical protein
MTSTLNRTCPLCGLRYENRPLLELHIREDHRRQAGRRGPGGTGASAPPAASPSRRYEPASRPSRTTRDVTAMTATRRPRGGQPMAAARRALRAVKYVNEELMRASETLIRSARAPQPRPRVQEPGSGYLHPGHATERADRAA